MTDTIEKTKIINNTDLSEPSQYKVIYINDEITTFEFVISSLMEIFNYNEETSYSIAKKVHDDGGAGNNNIFIIMHFFPIATITSA